VASNSNGLLLEGHEISSVDGNTGLRHREKELEFVIEALRRFSLGAREDSAELTRHLRWLLEVWDVAMGKTGLVTASGEPFLRGIELHDGQNARFAARSLYLCISPLEFFIIGLEEFIDDAFRGAVTRCGMSCERIAHDLLREVGELTMLDPKVKFKNKIGCLQHHLTQKGLAAAEHLCSTMQTVYDIRNQRGPHDVPSADELEAKFAVSSFPWIYARYLEAVQVLGYDLKDNMHKLVEVCNSIVNVGAGLAIKRGHKTVSAGEAIELFLYKRGFFESERSLREVLEGLESTGHNYPKPTMSNALEALTKKFLVRLGRPGGVSVLPKSSFFRVL